MTKITTALVLSNDPSTPIYQQIKNAIKQKITSQEWQPGQLVPSENQLAASLGISRMTINRPFRELTAEGLLRRVHGLGTFVAEPPRQAHLIEIVSIAEEIAQQGKSYRAHVLSLETIESNEALNELMQLEDTSKLYKLVVVHFQDEIPIQLEYRHVNASLMPDFINIDFNSVTPTDYLISQMQPEELEHVVHAIMPDEFTARHLDIPSIEPCLKLSRRTWVNSQVVTAAELLYPSSRYKLGDRYKPTNKSSPI